MNGFFKRFEAKYGKKADVSYGLRGYSAVQAWAAAANKAGSLEGSKVAAVLDAFDKEPLVIGPTTYTSKLHIQTTRPMAIMRRRPTASSPASGASRWSCFRRCSECARTTGRFGMQRPAARRR